MTAVTLGMVRGGTMPLQGGSIGCDAAEPLPPATALRLMRKLLHLLLLTLGHRTLWLARRVDPTGSVARDAVAERRVAAWYADPRHVTLQYDFALGDDPVVFDVGGYEGDWAAEMLCRFGARVEVFEPVPKFIGHLRRRFEFTDRVAIHAFGLGGRNARLPIAVGGERSSFVHDVRQRGELVEAEIRDVVEYLDDQDIERIDVLKLNIEGAEFELLERVLDGNRAMSFDHVLVQFHDELPDAPQRAAAISDRLSETHELQWRFPFVWECWRRRGLAPAEAI